MARGGNRPGAGRKRGTANVKTRQIADQAAKKGLTPLEVMLENMHWHRQRALEAEDLFTKAGPEITVDVSVSLRREAESSRKAAQACAGDAAPYIHPSLKSIEHKGDQDKPIRMEFVWADD